MTIDPTLDPTTVGAHLARIMADATLVAAFLDAAPVGQLLGLVELVEPDGVCAIGMIVGPVPGRWTFRVDASDPVRVGDMAELVEADTLTVRPARDHRYPEDGA